MKYLYQLTDDDFITMAKLVDNNFIGNNHIKVRRYEGAVRVYGHTEGGQCCNCDVRFDISKAKLNAVLTQNDDERVSEPFRHVYPPTLKRLIDWLRSNDFDYCPKEAVL